MCARGSRYRAWLYAVRVRVVLLLIGFCELRSPGNSHSLLPVRVNGCHMVNDLRAFTLPPVNESQADNTVKGILRSRLRLSNMLRS